ncbi:Cytochrome P450 3A16 [Halotydeus destructor]|nr:Cytochrome P450 3A16 [Halotydeus destructor]
MGQPFSVLASGSVVTATVVCYYYWSFAEKLKYWERKGVPGPRNSPLEYVVQLLRQKKDMYTGAVEGRDLYGKYYGVYLLTKPLLFITDPELNRLILSKDAHVFVNHASNFFDSEIMNKNLFFMADDDWRHNRALLTPAFTSGKIKKMFKLMCECSDDFVQHLITVRDQIDTKVVTQKYSLDVIARCCYATKCDPYNNEDSDFVKNALNALQPNPRTFLLAMMFPRLSKMFGIDAVDFKPVKYFEDLTLHMIKQRKLSTVRYDDFLQLLMDEEVAKDGPKYSSSKTKLTEKDIPMQLMNFFFAGKDTIVQIMKFAFYHLAVDADCQAKLHQEVSSLKEFTYDSVMSCQYLDAFVSETLRLHPFLATTRVANQDYVLGDTGVSVKKGDWVFSQTYAMHTNPEYFPDPMTFQPDRFLPENKHRIVPFSYTPFGEGPRQCIGMRFAQLQIKVAMARAVLRMKFSRSDKTLVPVQYVPGVSTFVPCKDIIIRGSVIQ